MELLQIPVILAYFAQMFFKIRKFKIKTKTKQMKIFRERKFKVANKLLHYEEQFLKMHRIEFEIRSRSSGTQNLRNTIPIVVIKDNFGSLNDSEEKLYEPIDNPFSEKNAKLLEAKSERDTAKVQVEK